MVNVRIITWIGLLFCLYSASPVSVQNQSTLSVPELRGGRHNVVYDLNWGNRTWFFLPKVELGKASFHLVNDL